MKFYLQFLIKFIFHFILTVVFLNVTACGNTEGQVVGNVPGIEPQTPFTMNVPFDQGTDSNYTFSDSAKVELKGGVVRLKAASQTDDATNTGPVSGGFKDGILSGVQWDSDNGYVRLDTATNNSELDSSWTPQWANLVAYWKINNNLLDAIGTNNGNINGATFTTSAKLGSHAGSFNGINNSVHMNGVYESASATWTAWVKFNDFSMTGGFNAHVLHQSNAVGSYETRLFVDVAGRVKWYIYNASAYVCQLSSPYVLLAGQWAYVAGTYGSGGCNLYINGTLVASNVTTSGAGVGATTFEMGNIRFQNKGFLNGLLDDVAIWKTVLTATQIKTIYDRQSARFSGQIKSRVLNAFSNQSWKTFSAGTTLPFFKELPSTVSSENSTGYSSIGGGLTSGLVGLWHFNENIGAPTIFDSSGIAVPNNGAATNITFKSLGVFGAAAKFDPATSSITIPDSNSLDFGTANFSASVWLYINGALAINSEYGIINKNSNFYSSSGWGLEASTWLCADGSYYLQGYITTQGAWGNSNVRGSSCLAPNKWHHVVLARSGTTLKLYINGVAQTPKTHADVGLSTNNAQPIRIGTHSWGPKTPLVVDEVALWTRELSSTEVLEIYRRGINRVKYQIRSCASTDCSDQDILTGGGWKGPDNTAQSYFSEIQNNSTISSAAEPTGLVNINPFNLSFSTFVLAGTGLSVTDNQYFQYRAILESDDENAQCNYGLGATSCSPELKSISLGPDHRATDASILTNTSIGSSYTSLDANAFTVTGENCPSVLRYALSGNGTNFYYWNGVAWIDSTNYLTASTSADVSAHLADFRSPDAGTLQIKTYFKSDGESTCQVDNIKVTGKN